LHGSGGTLEPHCARSASLQLYIKKVHLVSGPCSVLERCRPKQAGARLSRCARLGASTACATNASTDLSTGSPKGHPNRCAEGTQDARTHLQERNAGEQDGTKGGREDGMQSQRSSRAFSLIRNFHRLWPSHARVRSRLLHRHTSSRVWPGKISMFPILCSISSRWIRPHASAELSGTISATYTVAPASWSPVPCHRLEAIEEDARTQTNTPHTPRTHEQGGESEPRQDRGG
jgi:hypothetical protein